MARRLCFVRDLARRFGYKAAVVLGLCLYGAGALLFYPAAEPRTYGWFLAALFVIASGLAFLETSANPLVTVLGDPATASEAMLGVLRRPRFGFSVIAQFFYVGAQVGVWSRTCQRSTTRS